MSEGFQQVWWPTDTTSADMVAAARLKGMTMQEIADRCHVSRRAVTAWASGIEASYPHKSSLWEIAKGHRQSITPLPAESTATERAQP